MRAHRIKHMAFLRAYCRSQSTCRPILPLQFKLSQKHFVNVLPCKMHLLSASKLCESPGLDKMWCMPYLNPFLGASLFLFTLRSEMFLFIT